MKKIYKIILLVLIVFLVTLGGIFLFESLNNNNSIASAVVVDINDTNNSTNRSVHTNTKFKYIVTFELTKNSVNETVVKYYTRPTYTTNNSYYYTTNTTRYYYYTKPTQRTYTYTYYVYV